jgi:hypothetical protein
VAHVSKNEIAALIEEPEIDDWKQKIIGDLWKTPSTESVAWFWPIILPLILNMRDGDFWEMIREKRFYQLVTPGEDPDPDLGNKIQAKVIVIRLIGQNLIAENLWKCQREMSAQWKRLMRSDLRETAELVAEILQDPDYGFPPLDLLL